MEQIQNWIESSNIIKHNGRIAHRTQNSYQVRIEHKTLEKIYHASFPTYEQAFDHLKLKNQEFRIPSQNRYRDMGNHYEVELSKGIIMKIDKEDLKLVEQYALCSDQGYCIYHNRETKKSKRFHQLIMNFDQTKNSDLVIDHLNGEKSDNRKQNLRIVDKSLNSRNSKQTTNKSGIVGVSKRKGCNYWVAQFAYKNTIYRQGLFNTSDEANIWLIQKMNEIIPEQERILPNRQIVQKV